MADDDVSHWSLSALQALLVQALESTWGKVAVAVSGGVDSMALLWLLKECAGPDIICLSVDHGLRPESSQEAALVARWCATQNITHEILVWQGIKPNTGLQAAAREARYGLLAAACVRHKAPALLCAHHLDDQTETVFARLARGSGAEGLAGMRVRRKIAAGAGPAVDLLRPLLAVPKARLVRLATEQNLPVVVDSSNENHDFERVRRRAFLGAMEAQEFFSGSSLVRAGARARAAADLSDELVQEDFVSVGGYLHGSGAIFLDRNKMIRLADTRRNQLLARVLGAVSGNVHGPATDDMAALWREQRARVSFGGALLVQRKDEVWAMREPAALLGRADGGVRPLRLPVVSGGTYLWDRRVIVQVPEVAGALTLTPAGFAPTGARHLRELLSTMPILWSGEALIAVPIYLNKINIPAHTPWKKAPSVLDTRIVTAERLAREVIRFAAPKA